MPEPGAAPPARSLGEAQLLDAIELMARTANDAITVTDLDARVVIWNPSVERLFGIPASIAIGRSIHDVMGSAVVGTGDQLDPRATALERGWWRGRRIERTAIGPNVGRDVIVEIALSRLETGDGTPIGVLSIRRDVTASVRLEQEFAALGSLATATGAARTREEVADGAIGLLCAATGADFGAIIRHDGDQGVIEGSRGLGPDLRAVIQGRVVSESPLVTALRSSGDILAGPIDDVPMRQTSRDALHGLGVAAIAGVGLRRQGELTGTLVLGWSDAAMARPSDAALLQAAAHVEHALENMRLVEGLTASEQRYRTLFDESPEALLLQTSDGDIVDANAAALRTFRAQRGWLVGRTASEVTGAGLDALHLAQATRGPDAPARLRSTGTGADGRSFPIELEIAPVSIEGTDRLLVLVRDLSVQAELQAELIQAQKMDAMGQLVSGVAHELNNPLAAIIAFSQLIRHDPDLPEALRRDADALNQEADRTRRIVQNLLDFARQRPPERHPTRLDSLVRTVLELQAYSLSTNRIEVVVDIPTSLPLVPIDRAQLQQVLLNLTRNAIQAIAAWSDRGRITFVAREVEVGPPSSPKRRMVRLEIGDDGPGVESRHRDRLFLPFFTTKPPGEGTGLGLPVSFGIIAAHGGHLRFEPGPGGTGATFVIELPEEAAGAWTGHDEWGGADIIGGPASGPPAPVGVASAPDFGRGEVSPATVLVLDDEPSIRRLLIKVLRVAGHRPVAAADGPEAVAIVKEGGVAAVLCDHRMAGMTGIDVYEAIVAQRPELATRFVFMSGDVLNPDLLEFARSRGIGLLAKPFDVDAALRAVRDLLEAGLPSSGPSA